MQVYQYYIIVNVEYYRFRKRGLLQEGQQTLQPTNEAYNNLMMEAIIDKMR